MGHGLGTGLERSSPLTPSQACLCAGSVDVVRVPSWRLRLLVFFFFFCVIPLALAFLSLCSGLDFSSLCLYFSSFLFPLCFLYFFAFLQFSSLVFLVFLFSCISCIFFSFLYCISCSLFIFFINLPFIYLLVFFCSPLLFLVFLLYFSYFSSGFSSALSWFIFYVQRVLQRGDTKENVGAWLSTPKLKISVWLLGLHEYLCESM